MLGTTSYWKDRASLVRGRTAGVPPSIPITAFDAQPDGVISTGSMSASSNALTLPTGTNISAADVGKVVRVADAGFGGADLQTTIAAPLVGTPNKCTLAQNASMNVTNAQVVYGTDTSPALGRAAAVLDGQGIAIEFDGPGIFVFGSANDITSRNLIVVGQAGTTLCSIFPPDGTGHSALFLGDIIPADANFNGVALSADVVVGSSTVKMASAPTVGDLIRLTTNQTVQITAYYRVQAVSGSSGNYTVTVDRPIWGPFTMSGVNVTTVDRILVARTQFQLIGNGVVITGTGSRHIEIFGGLRCYVENVRFDESGGYTVGGAQANSYDEGSIDSQWVRCTANLPHSRSMFSLEGLGEGNRIVDCVVEATSGTGLGLYDQHGAVVRGCRIIGGTYTNPGIWVTTNNNGRSIACVIQECVVSGCGNGIQIDAAQNTSIIGCTADENGGNGIALKANDFSGALPFDTSIVSTRARMNATNGLYVAAGAKGTTYKDIDVSGNASSGVVAYDDCHGVGCVSCKGSSTGSTAVIEQLGGIGRHMLVNITIDWPTVSTTTNGIYVFNADCTVTGQVTFENTSSTKIGVNGDANAETKVCVYDFKLLGTGSGNTGLLCAANATLRIGDNVDVSIAATPLAVNGYCNRGTVLADQAMAVNIAFPDMKSTEHAYLRATQASGQAWVSSETAGAGFAITSVAGDSHTYGYEIR